MLWESGTPVLVSEDTSYREHRRDYSALFFNRQATTAPAATPWFLLRAPRPPAFLTQDTFVSVIPVLEAYGQNFVQPGTAAQKYPYPISTRLGEPEEPYKRFDHSIYFQMVRRYTAQLIGFTFDQPDFNDHPWLDPWPTRPKDLSAAFFPFRSPVPAPQGQQFNLYFCQPPSPRLDPEADVIRIQRYDAFFFPLPVIIPVAPIPTKPTKPQNLRTSSTRPPIVLLWDPVLTATSYNVYRDNIVIASVLAPTTTFTDPNVTFNKHYHYMVTAVNSLGESDGSTPIFNVYIEPNGTLKFEVVWTQTAGHLGVPDIEWTWD